MKLISLIFLSLTLTGIQSDSQKDIFIGKWSWIESKIFSQAGITTINPTTENETKSVEITKDYKIKIIQNGKIVCEEEFVLPEIKTEEIPFIYTDNCSMGTFQIVNDTLQFYRYLGCPSITSYFVKNQE